MGGRRGEGCAVGSLSYFWLCSFPNFDENMHDFCSPFSFLPDMSFSLHPHSGKKAKKLKKEANVILTFSFLPDATRNAGSVEPHTTSDPAAKKQKLQ